MVENKYFVVVALVLFLVVLWLSDGSLMAGFGVLALSTGLGWIVRRVTRGRR